MVASCNLAVSRYKSSVRRFKSRTMDQSLLFHACFKRWFDLPGKVGSATTAAFDQLCLPLRVQISFKWRPKHTAGLYIRAVGASSST
eukprot:scaffold33232_cov20-Prasinocladus_malaysianus.AAC.1